MYRPSVIRSVHFLPSVAPFISFIHYHVQNATIPCRSQQLLPFLSVVYSFPPPSSSNLSSILPHFVLPSISRSTSQPYFSKFILKTFLGGIQFSSILCTCPNQLNLFSLTVSAMFGFLTIENFSLLVNILQHSISLSYTGPNILLYTFRSNMFRHFLSLFVYIQVSDVYVKDLCIIVYFNINFTFLDVLLFLKNFCSMRYVL